MKCPEIAERREHGGNDARTLEGARQRRQRKRAIVTDCIPVVQISFFQGVRAVFRKADDPKCFVGETG
jgi:hypothetical protein